jgi:hypothetical protein
VKGREGRKRGWREKGGRWVVDEKAVKGREGRKKIWDEIGDKRELSRKHAL